MAMSKRNKATNLRDHNVRLRQSQFLDRVYWQHAQTLTHALHQLIWREIFTLHGLVTLVGVRF
jgi:hypothetical protein